MIHFKNERKRVKKYLSKEWLSIFTICLEVQVLQSWETREEDKEICSCVQLASHFRVQWNALPPSVRTRPEQLLLKRIYSTCKGLEGQRKTWKTTWRTWVRVVERRAGTRLLLFFCRWKRSGVSSCWFVPVGPFGITKRYRGKRIHLIN